jgi:hypothetical protein
MWFHTSFLGDPSGNPDDSMPAHTEGHEGNLLVGTKIRSLWMSGLLDGAPGAPTASHLFVAPSLTLVALGGSDLTRRVLPSNPKL